MMDRFKDGLFVPSPEGHVGNLKRMTTAQVIEIAQRQEKLLKKRTFLQSMPDKGDRIQKFLDTLQQELATRKQNVPLNKVSLTPANEHNFKGNNSVTLGPESVSGIKQNVKEKAESTDELEKTFDGLTMSEVESDAKLEKHKHQFEVALERAEENQRHSKEVLLLNKTLKVEHIQDLPKDILDDKPAVTTRATKVKGTVQEESAVHPPNYKHNSVETISVMEAIDLQLQQRQKQEELQAQLAAEKLVERLNVRMETYNPEGVDMSYRIRKDRYGVDVDSDDDPDDEEEEKEDNKGHKMTVSDTED